MGFTSTGRQALDSRGCLYYTVSKNYQKIVKTLEISITEYYRRHRLIQYMDNWDNCCFISGKVYKMLYYNLHTDQQTDNIQALFTH